MPWSSAGRSIVRPKPLQETSFNGPFDGSFCYRLCANEAIFGSGKGLDSCGEGSIGVLHGRQLAAPSRRTPMPKLTDSQLVILSTAAGRDDRAVLPLPKSLKINKGAAASVLKSLLKRGLIAERTASQHDEAWQEDEDGRRIALIVADAGLQAIGTEPHPEATPQPPASTAQKTKRRDSAKPTPIGAKPKSRTDMPAARPGTKLALLTDLLRRKNGATIGEAAKATGWQLHSVRGAISGALKKKLGLAIENKIADGRGRIYRIVERG
jgi:hypothetical protein